MDATRLGSFNNNDIARRAQYRKVASYGARSCQHHPLVDVLAGKAAVCHNKVVERDEWNVAQHLADSDACSRNNCSALHRIVWIRCRDVVHEQHRYCAGRPERRRYYKHATKEYQYRVVDAFHDLSSLAAQCINCCGPQHSHCT